MVRTHARHRRPAPPVAIFRSFRLALLFQAIFWTVRGSGRADLCTGAPFGHLPTHCVFEASVTTLSGRTNQRFRLAAHSPAIWMYRSVVRTRWVGGMGSNQSWVAPHFKTKCWGLQARMSRAVMCSSLGVWPAPTGICGYREAVCWRLCGSYD